MWKSKNLKCRKCDVLLNDLSDQGDTQAWLTSEKNTEGIKKFFICPKCEMYHWMDKRNYLCHRESENQFVCVRPPDWYCSQCDKGMIDRYESNFDGICDACYVGNCLEKIHSDTLKFSHLILLDVNIEDCSDDIITEGYMLLRVDEKTRDILNDLWLAFRFNFDANERFTSKSKYIFVAHSEEYRIDGRGVAYLNNRFGDSLYFSNVTLMGMSILRRDWTNLHLKKGNTLNITLEGFRDCLAISKYTETPSVNDIDVKLILEKINQNDGAHLFRGVNKIYGEDSGIASSIYRNNKAKIAEGKLQEYEKSITNKLLKQRYPEIITTIDALTELRHLGQDTSFVDFTEDPMIALFFACQKINDTEGMGELIYFDSTILEEKKDVQYPVLEDFVIRPSIGQISARRVKSQKSVFVYAHQGYLSRDRYQAKIQHLAVDPSLKGLLLKKCGHSDSDIYPDVLAFCDNSRNFLIPTNLLNDSEKAKEYLKAMLSRSIPPKYVFLYFLDISIEDYVSDIVKEDYMLLRIDEKFSDTLKSFSHRFSNFNDLVTKSKYVLAVKEFELEQRKRLDGILKISTTLIWDSVYGDWIYRQEHALVTDITLKEIENIVGMTNQEKKC